MSNHPYPSGRQRPGASDFRSDINGLRALSVWLVVFFHAHVRGADGGFIGVDIFFVISGFLMTKIIMEGLDAGSFSFWGFMRARAARIWPALGTLVLALLVLGAILLPPSDLLQIAHQSFWALIFWSNQIFHDSAGYDTQGADGNWFLHTWSLSVEWQFYVLYPLALMLVARLQGRAKGALDGLRPGGLPRRTVAILCCVVCLFALSLACYLIQSAKNPNSAFFLLTARAWEPLAGGLVFLLADGRGAVDGRRRAAASYAGVALVVLSALWLGYRHVDPVGLGWYSIVPVAGAMLTIGSACPRNVLLDNRFMQAIGRWSYSIYLWHWPLVVICAMDAVLDRHPLAGRSFVIAGSVFLGWLSFRFVESRPRSPGPLRLRLTAAKPFLALGTAALAASVAVASRGLEFRMPSAGAAPFKPATESDYYPAECSNFQKEVRDVRPCKIEKKGSRRTVLVIGDSLGEHLYPWFKNHTQVSVDFLTEADCPPIPNFDTVNPAFHCGDFARLAWHEAAQPRYDTVVISGRWELVGGIGPVYCHHDASGRCVVVNGIEKRDLVLAELRSAIRGLLDIGKTVVVLEGTPAAYIDVPQRLARERYWFGEPRFSISAASVAADYAWIDPMFAEFKGVQGYHLVSLRPTLCDATTCKVYDTVLKRPVYANDRHFDPIWMNAHGDIFAPFVQPERLR
jgi:peptidoglycan/LPS O-acetylase OafA/YrhL